ncbi:MAG TPA: ABC-F family ATP-binding cassette domain-containing protein [Gemmatimonadales bacterium]|nr:ABC-F family ATP-binding cassette domain-containing protein [Gemmatimonadales bacterium]
MTQLSVSGVALEFGAIRLFADVTFTVARGDKWGVVGRNGSGKTSLFRILTGEAEPTRGTVARISGLRFSIMEQHREFAGATTVWEAAAGPFAELLELERSLAEQGTTLAEAGERCTPAMLARYDRDLERFEREGGYTLAPRIDAVLHGLGFDPDKARAQALAGLSGGERGRLGLAHQLVAPADVLLLDEPTNHLDLETTRWLEEYLRGLDATVLLISHDRAFLQNVVDHVLHVEAETATPYTGDYEAFVRQRTERRLAQQRAYTKQARVITSEEDFIRRNIAGQNSAQAKGRRRRLARVSRLSPPPGEEGVMSLRLEADARGGDQVLVADSVRVAIGERILLDRFSARVQRGDVIGFIGPNGSGKTTLLRTIVGERQPDGGTIRIPESVRSAHYRQDLAQVPVSRSLYEVINDLRPSWGRGAIQGHLGRFGFSGDTVLRQTATLSGGERARMALAMIMLSGANLLLFDEPTNHLDVESIEALEDAIEVYDGTVILVSHDRTLLRTLTTRVWVLHDGRITDFPGSFEEWEAASAERAHAAAVEAAEEEALRRVHERKQTRRSEGGRKEKLSARRTAERKLAEAEAAVAEREAKVAAIRARLEDPALYATSDGAARAHNLGTELEAARVELDGALAQWEAATATLEKASRG